MDKVKKWLKQGTWVGSGPLRFKVTGAFWLVIACAILVMLFQKLWMWAIIFGVVGIVMGIAVGRAKRKR